MFPNPRRRLMMYSACSRPLRNGFISLGFCNMLKIWHHPGTVDGIMWRFTRSALNEFQETHGLSATDEINEEVLSSLKEKTIL